MKKGIILYRSKYGATKKYAGWLQETLGYDCEEASGAALRRAAAYDVVLFCGAVYASGIKGLSLLKKSMRTLHGKKVAVLCVGASPYDEAAFTALRQRHFGGELEGIPVWYARGAWDTDAMTAVDRTLCNMLKKSLAKRDPATYEPWMQALMSVQDGKADWTDKAYLAPLIAYCTDENQAPQKE